MPFTPQTSPGGLGGFLAIVGLGALLGLGQNGVLRYSENQAHLKDFQRKSVTWIKREAPPAPKLEESSADGAAAPEPQPLNADPLAGLGGLGSAGADLPDVPDIAQPIQMQLKAVRKFHAAEGAVFVDARTPDEYAEGHIPGAINMPYDLAVTDPALLESFDAGGKPIIVYCGGGTCEMSMSLAWAMIQSGQKKVLVFMGGMPEWEQAGYEVAKGKGA